MEAAILVHDVHKTYGKGTKANKVLKGLNMLVQKGHIYGLLGSSGCGKTTLLSCIVGILSPDSGIINVLGHTVHKGANAELERKIGFMPQEMGLVEEFRIKEVIKYFGYIYGLSENEVDSKFEFLSDLLDLPPPNRFVRDCSGGQKRRVSFAATLIHDPELLILDEPTVGLDPILRDTIWNYLVEITTKLNKSVIITTHYIEETRQANMIGLMRGGEIMAEESPDFLLELLHCETLESVFLHLSDLQNRGEHAPEFNTHEYRVKRNEVSTFVAQEVYKNKQSQSVAVPVKKSQFNVHRLYALTFKAIKQTYRSPSHSKILKMVLLMPAFLFEKRKMLNLKTFTFSSSLFAFMILYPIVMLLIFFNSIGNEINGLSIGIINDESSLIDCDNYTLSALVKLGNYDERNCSISKVSCHLLNGMNETRTKKRFFDRIEDAQNAMKQSQIHGYLHIPSNFSQALSNRMNYGVYTDDQDLLASEISAWAGEADYNIMQTLKLELFEKYMQFSEDVSKVCQISAGVFKMPLAFKTPVYGSVHQSFNSFMAPGFVLLVIYFASAVMTSTLLTTERLEGIWNRNKVAGLTTYEVLFVHITSQLIINLIPVFITLFLVKCIYSVVIEGSFFLLTLICVLEGWNGVLHGLLISVISRDYDVANFIVTGSFMPVTLMSGVIWPVQGMPELMQKIVVLFPYVNPILGFRDIMIKGWDYHNSEVAAGFYMLVIWLGIFSALTFTALKFKM